MIELENRARQCIEFHDEKIVYDLPNYKKWKFDYIHKKERG